MTPEDIIRRLELKPHPEGGHYAETHRIPDPHDHGHRSPGTAIYYLLAEGERSHWHKVDATEIWHFYAGDPLELSLAVTGADFGRLDARGMHRVAGLRVFGVHDGAAGLGAGAEIARASSRP
jgi:predicted cupin superfamily sugar epimerase